MKWFKHYSNTTMVEPVRRVFSELGLYGLGAMWLIVERIHLNDGKIMLKEVKGLTLSHQFTNKKLTMLLCNYGIFKVNTQGKYVTLDPRFGTAEEGYTNDNTNDNTNDSPSLAPASCSTNPVEEENKKEEEEEERTLSKSPSGGAEEETVVDPLVRFAAQPWHDLAQQMATAEAHRAWRQQVEMSLGWPDLRLPRAWPEAIALVCGMAVEGGSEGRLMCESHFKGYFTFLCRHGTFAPRLRSELTARMLALRRGSMPDDERSFYDYMKQRYPHLTQWQEPLTFEQYRQLRSQYPISLIASLLDKLNNRPLREQRISVGETMREWIAKVKG